MGVFPSAPYVPSPEYQPVTNGYGVNNLQAYIKPQKTSVTVQEMQQSSSYSCMNWTVCYCETEEPVCNPLKAPTGKLIPRHQAVRCFDSTEASGGAVGPVNHRLPSTTRSSCEGTNHLPQHTSHRTTQRVKPIVFPPREFETFPMDDAPPDVALRVFTAQREERLDQESQ